MLVLATYFHNIDPIIVSILGVHLWWYGLSYTLGFLNAHFFVRRNRGMLGLSNASVYNLSLVLAGAVLFGGRLVEVAFYEWPFYSQNLHLIPALWLGGMASHGLLVGGLIGVWLFARYHQISFLRLSDALAIPAAFILGVGRIGNFIDGQIVGSVTSVPWAVKFPDAEGFRHPVVLYDGIKNLLIIPVLIYARSRKLPEGVVSGIFLFLYAFLRIFVDIYREYPTSLFGLATGQMLNIFMSISGVVLIVVPFWLKGKGPDELSVNEGEDTTTAIGWRRPLFIFILLFSLIIPSDWTQDIPARYGDRHPGLDHSPLYPKIDTLPE